MDEVVVQLARQMLIKQSLGLLKQGVEQIGELLSTDKLAVLAAIANVAHRLSLNEVLQDARNQGHEFYPDQMSIITRRISVERMIRDFVECNQDPTLVLQYVQDAMSPNQEGNTD